MRMAFDSESGWRDDLVKHSSPESGVLEAHVPVTPVLGESNFEALADQLKLGVFIYSVDGRTLYVNKAISRMSGYTTSELLALPVNARYAQQEELKCFVDQLVEHGCVQNFAAVAVHKDGAHYHTLMSAAVVRNHAGEPEYVVGTTEDMTERKRAEEALVLIMHSLDAGQELAYWFDPAGNIVYANAAGCRALGYTREELLKLSVADINPQFTRERWAEGWSAFRGNRSIGFESEFRRKDGSCFPAEIRGAYFESDGKEYFHGYVKDLTELRRAEKERKTLQEQLLHAQKMESIGRLAGGIAHDFNNMLGVILGESELCLDALDADSPLRADLEEIRDAALRSVGLTRQLLAFTRRQSTQPKVLDLNGTVSEMLSMMRRLIGEGVELEWRPGPALWPVCIDPSHINQLLANLCVNARDAIKGTGTITIATENASFDDEHALSDRRGDFARLAVTDTGAGMSDETMTHVFEPFFTTKELGHGTGLGLSSVYGIVTQNQGFVDVQTSPGTGTTFSVYLPRHHEERSTQAEDGFTSPGVSKGRETILLVEDEPAVSLVEQRMLERLGYQVLVARTPREAIGVMQQQGVRIELVVLDVVMPEMNGHELAIYLTQMNPELRVLFVSGYPVEAIADYGVPNPSSHILQKPLTAQTLSSKIREALDAAVGKRA